MIIETGWENPDTVKQYQDFSESYSAYRITSQDLVSLAEINQGMSVVDLACGTGITTEVILKRLLNTGEVYSVDFSHPMLDIAQSRVSSPRVFFVNSSAECLNNHIPRKVDRVVCNSAIWQTNMEESFKAVSCILNENGKFAFNLCENKPSFYNHCVEQYHAGVLYQTMYSVAQSEYNYPKNRHPGDATFGFDNIDDLLTRNGLVIELKKITEIVLTLNEARDFLLIPVMTEKRLFGLSYSKRREIVEKACQGFDPTATFTISWMNYLAKKAARI